ncbi:MULTISPECIES: type VI secretion system baseplate subunit TssF [Burkholderia]|uniref:Type VI secretion system baseplate subunit TssF n=1 Tax=Burkholderia sola TaxID=2843302 RepID=A0ABV2CGE7_9BURK|nr:type VI secretion system baseplate subunit TssF [Burkholderia sp. CpTa8-5]MBP0610221.1 type VI secretion system baseplate subunit TssF [Burkholderia sp. CpTa8-5]
MDHLLSHYEYELGLFARALGDFAIRYPKIAARLGIQSGRSDDPHVARLIQTFSFLAAHLDSKLADDYPEFTEALLEVVHPHYLRTIPSCAIASVEPRTIVGQLTEPIIVPRGMALNARTAPIRFRSAYDVTLSPLQIRSARYAPAMLAPSAVRLPTDATGVLSISFASAAGPFTAAIPDGPVRIYLSGERPFVSSLLDALLLRAAAAYVEVDQCGRWRAISKVPFEPVGFADDDRLLPDNRTTSRTATTYRYLLEYFAFPELFDFVDLDIGRVRRAASAPDARELTLHVVLRDTPADSVAALALASLDAAAFKLFCTPVVNLFSQPALPIVLKGQDAYPVQPMRLAKHSPLGVYSVDAVYLGELSRKKDKDEDVSLDSDRPRTLVRPYQALSHDPRPDSAAVYWVAFRDRDTGSPGRQSMMLSLVGLDGQSVRPKLPQIDVVTTVTNGDLPARLSIGNPVGDLLLESKALDCPIQLITRPTLTADLPRGHGALWRVLSTLAPHPLDLTRDGLSGLKAFLRLHAVRTTPFALRCIDAITELDYKPAMKWMSLDNQFPSFVRGIEIMLSLDETALREVSLVVFTKLLERFFAPYGPTNSYVQLVIRSAQTGQELTRGAAMPGTQPLI